MADRKQLLSTAARDPELEELLRSAPQVTEDQLQEQRISFAFGNAPESELITKDSVRKSSKTILIANQRNVETCR